VSSNWEPQKYLAHQLQEDYQLLKNLQDNRRYEDDELRKGKLDKQIREVGQRIDNLEKRLTDQGLFAEKIPPNREASQGNFVGLPPTQLSSQDTSASNKQAVNVFISYASKDESLRQRFEEICLSSLEQEGVISFWHQGKMRAGTNKIVEINRKLASCHLFLPLITPGYVYSYNRKLEDIFRQASVAEQLMRSGKTRIIPVLLQQIWSWKKLLFGELQSLPRNAKFADSGAWRNRNHAFNTISEELESDIQEFNG
jgi:hypothetical protein